jgi:hypothetical protein
VAIVRSAAYPVIAQGLATRRDALRRQAEALFAAELDRLGRRDRDEVLSALEATTSFEAVDLLVSHRGLSPAQVEAVVARTVVALLTTT